MKNHRDNQKAKMQTKDENLKQSIIKTRNIIRKKFQDLHNHKLAINEKVSETFKPIIEPLQSLIKTEKIKRDEEADSIKLEKTEPKKEYVYLPNSVFKTAVAPHRENPFLPSSFNKSANQTGHDISGVSPLFEEASDENSFEDRIVDKLKKVNSPHLDAEYGFRYRHGELMLGKDRVKVSTKNSISTYSIGKKRFPATPGVTELLLSSNPKGYREDDLKVYRDMLVHTSAHKSNYNKHNEVNRDKSNPKYDKVISKLFPTSQRRANAKKGDGLKKPQTKYKSLNGKSIDDGFNYVYWDDPNELVNRLRLLTASQAAGHTGHDNEIISIIEELREAKIIK